MASVEQELCIPSTAHLPPPQFPANSYLTVDGTNTTVPLETATNRNFILIGRQAATVDIRIDHGSISRKHAALYLSSDDEWRLQDLGGKHGCHVNGLRVNSSVVLKNRDTLTFGNLRDKVFRFHKHGSSAENEAKNGDKLSNDSLTMQKKGQHGSEEEHDGLSEASDSSHGENGAPTTSAPAAAEERQNLTGRAKREAEIALIMDSLDSEPTYTKFVPTTNVGDDCADTAIFSIPHLSTTRMEEKTANETAKSIEKNFSLPLSKYLLLPCSNPTSKSRVITTLALDPSGSRLLTGATDTHVRFYDFGGMDARGICFKEVEIEDGHPIVDGVWSNTGDRVLIGCTSAQPTVLDREGREIIQFIKGDVYVTDQANTTGHTAAVTSVSWHPLERDIVLTSSIDGSARLWNLTSGKTQFKKLICDRVYRTKNAKGQRIGVTSAVFAPGGRELALGTACGSVQIWNATKLETRPNRVVYDAHGAPGRAVHSLVYNSDGTKLASRSMDDDAVRVWDTKRLSKSAHPIAICTGLPNLYEHSNCAFSPKGTVLCAGTSVAPPARGDEKEGLGRLRPVQSVGAGIGMLKFYALLPTCKESVMSPGLVSDPILELEVVAGVSVVKVVWHSKLNQIFVGLSDGNVRIFYDPVLSINGALLSTAKGARTEDDLTLLLRTRAPQGSAGITGEILTPHALPMFRENEKSTKRKREKERSDPIKSRRPEPPGTGIKVGEGTSAGVNFQQFVSSTLIKTKNIAGKDPREELFKYSEGKKSYVSKLHEGDGALAEKTAEEEEADMKEGKT